MENLRNVVTGHLNINSVRNKFDLIFEQIKGNINVLVVSETELDKSFPIGQFEIPGYVCPFRLDRDQYDGGTMVFIR